MAHSSLRSPLAQSRACRSCSTDIWARGVMNPIPLYSVTAQKGGAIAFVRRTNSSSLCDFFSYVIISPMFTDVLFIMMVIAVPRLTTITKVRGVTVSHTLFFFQRQRNILNKTGVSKDRNYWVQVLGLPCTSYKSWLRDFVTVFLSIKQE